MAYLLDAVDSFGENRTLARKHLNTLNCTEAHSLAGEIRGRLFWSKKTQYKHDHTRKQIAFFGWLLREIAKRIRNGSLKPELSVSGSVIQRNGSVLGGVLCYAAIVYASSEWKPLDLDGFSGMAWVNTTQRQICLYCEGDTTLLSAPDEQTFLREIQVHKSFG